MLIYAVETTTGHVVALANDADAANKLNASGKHGVLTLRWANEAEHAKFRQLAASRRQTGWLARTLARWLRR